MAPDELVSMRLHAVGAALAHDALAVEILDALRERGVRALLLKGSSTTALLGADRAARPSTDVDVLVAPQKLPLAEDLLVALGFQATEPDRPHLHARAWIRRAPPGVVDLHRTLVGPRASPERVWEVLSAETDWLDVEGGRVETMSEAARALHLALHAAQRVGGKREADLEEAVRVLPPETWAAAAELARSVDAVPSLSVGLRLVEDGRVIADRLGLPRTVPAEVLLRARGDTSLNLHRLAQTTGVRRKAGFLLLHLFPPPARMRERYTEARASSVALVLVYAKRLAAIALGLPRALRALAHARRQERERDW